MRSKSFAWSAMVVMLVVIVLAMCMHVLGSIWEYSVLFLAFMAVFCHLASVLLAGMSGTAAKKLDIAAGIFGTLGVIGIIVLFIFDWHGFY